jgi:hypothetical protein
MKQPVTRWLIDAAVFFTTLFMVGGLASAEHKIQHNGEQLRGLQPTQGSSGTSPSVDCGISLLGITSDCASPVAPAQPRSPAKPPQGSGAAQKPPGKGQ